MLSTQEVETRLPLQVSQLPSRGAAWSDGSMLKARFEAGVLVGSGHSLPPAPRPSPPPGKVGPPGEVGPLSLVGGRGGAAVG